MKLGLIARADNRGLGIQTWEFYRHLRPARTLVIRMGDLTPYEEHVGRYTGNVRATSFDGTRVDDDAIDWFLSGVDSFYTAETPYDYRIFQQATERNIRSVLHINYEFMRYLEDKTLPEPTVFVAPSTWNLHNLPFYVPYLPVPVDRQRLPFALRTSAHTFLHVGGHPAMADRNGTELIRTAVQFITADIKLIIRSQRPIQDIPSTSNVEVVYAYEDLDYYWDLYRDADVLLQPRRYGGLSLPMQEAQSCGMPIITLDRQPEKSFLPEESLVNGWLMRHIRNQCGLVEVFTCDPRMLARRIDELANNPDLVERMSKDADTYASTLSWDTLAPKYRRFMRV